LRVRARRLRDGVGTGPLIVLAVLVAIDLALVGLHLLHGLARHSGAASGMADNVSWGLDKDGGYAEQFGYLQLAALVILLLGRAVGRRAWLSFGWAVTFAVTLADDSLELHERYGGTIVNWTGLHAAFGLRAQDFGELAVWTALGVCIVAVLVLCYLRSDNAERTGLQPLLFIALALGFLAVVVDMVHSVFRGWPMGQVLTVVEDGGELLLSSAALACGVHLATGGIGRVIASAAGPEVLEQLHRPPG
jgi:hypothetical protein